VPTKKRTRKDGIVTEPDGRLFIVYETAPTWKEKKQQFVRKQKWERVLPRYDDKGRAYYSREDAKKLRADRISQMARGEFVEPSKMTFEQFKDIWLKKYATAEVRPTTLDQYESLFKLHLTPYLGALTLAQMTVEHIQGFKAALQKKNLGPQQVKHALRLTRQMLNHAVDWGYLRTNPALKVRYPTVPKPEIDPLTPAEIQAFFIALAEEYAEQPTAHAKWRALHMVAITGALRIGEILAMRWGNLDRMKGQYFVKETWHRPKRGRAAYFDGEPRVDVALLESEEKLSIYIQKEASSDHEATPLHVMTFEIG
jgi:integrase